MVHKCEGGATRHATINIDIVVGAMKLRCDVSLVGYFIYTKHFKANNYLCTPLLVYDLSVENLYIPHTTKTPLNGDTEKRKILTVWRVNR